MKLIRPESHDHWLALKSEDISSTEVSALFGLNPWVTEFELWHRKANKEVVIIEENERMKWGNRLEAAIAEGIAEDQGWNVKLFKDYGRIEGERIGSSFDFVIVDDQGEPTGLLEIKNVDGIQFKHKWVIEDGQVIEAPPHIELQAQHQLMVTGLPVIYIGALVGGNSVALLKRTPREPIINAIKTKIKKFWDSVDNNRPPSPDFERDAAFIASLYDTAEPGKAIEETQEISETVKVYKEYSEAAKNAIKKRDAAKAELLTLIGDAEKVIGEGFTISAGVVGPAQVSFERKAYRNFRVHFKKEKK